MYTEIPTFLIVLSVGGCFGTFPISSNSTFLSQYHNSAFSMLLFLILAQSTVLKLMNLSQTSLLIGSPSQYMMVSGATMQ